MDIKQIEDIRQSASIIEKKRELLGICLYDALENGDKFSAKTALMIMEDIGYSNLNADNFRQLVTMVQ